MVISGYREKVAAKSMSQAPRQGGDVDGALVDCLEGFWRVGF